jgi:hypothetical protein
VCIRLHSGAPAFRRRGIDLSNLLIVALQIMLLKP